jgi:hypothetical protein
MCTRSRMSRASCLSSGTTSRSPSAPRAHAVLGVGDDHCLVAEIRIDLAERKGDGVSVAARRDQGMAQVAVLALGIVGALGVAGQSLRWRQSRERIDDSHVQWREMSEIA